MAPARDVQQLLTMLDQGYRRQSWHGPNLRGALRGVTFQQACWRPGPGRHNIWELALHCAYWKYAVWRRLAGERRGAFPRGGSNWFARSAHDGEAQWRADVRLLDEMHRALHDVVSTLPPRTLHRKPKGGKVTTSFLVSGIIAHDLYHAGQIQLLKRLSAGLSGR